MNLNQKSRRALHQGVLNGQWTGHADTLTNIEKLSFSDISRVDLTLGSPLPVKDILSTNSTGGAITRSAPHLISKTQLLQNDRDWDSDVSQLTITSAIEAKGGTVSITGNGDILFTPDASFTGVMSFKYTIADNTNLSTQVINSATGQTELMKAAVYLQTGDLPSDPLAVEQWYLTDTNVLAAWGTAKSIAHCAHSMPANNRFGLKKTTRWLRRRCVAEIPRFKLHQHFVQLKKSVHEGW